MVWYSFSQSPRCSRSCKENFTCQQTISAGKILKWVTYLGYFSKISFYRFSPEICSFRIHSSFEFSGSLYYAKVIIPDMRDYAINKVMWLDFLEILLTDNMFASRNVRQSLIIATRPSFGLFPISRQNESAQIPHGSCNDEQQNMILLFVSMPPTM